jgi:hypothetical protein
MGQALTELTSVCELFQRVAEAAAEYAAVIDALYTA